MKTQKHLQSAGQGGEPVPVLLHEACWLRMRWGLTDISWRRSAADHPGSTILLSPFPTLQAHISYVLSLSPLSFSSSLSSSLPSAVPLPLLSFLISYRSLLLSIIPFSDLRWVFVFLCLHVAQTHWLFSPHQCCCPRLPLGL